ncbi:MULTISPECIES: SWIM zinc finger family protein [Corynebacterium]|uniref:SWIM zinc finger family protein n=1 Tax=Corynebacterium TaxID=1716 RepID=UPI000EB91208|nr:hypothetical protein [Corynebacterium flavescens]
MVAAEQDNVIYANFGARKRVSSPEQVHRVSALSDAATRVTQFIYKNADSGRISRGRQYAAGGHVVGLDVRNGAVHGRVAGSQNEPFAVLIQLPFRSNDDIARISEIFARTPNSLAQAREGVFSPEVLDLLFAADADELRFSCTCPDSSYVCKHVVAVGDKLAARIDADPAVALSLRGLDLGRLEQSVLDQAESVAKESYDNAGLDAAERSSLFWEGRAFPDLPRPKVAPALEDSDPELLRKAMRAVSHTNIDLLRAVSDVEDLYHHLTH